MIITYRCGWLYSTTPWNLNLWFAMVSFLSHLKLQDLQEKNSFLCFFLSCFVLEPVSVNEALQTGNLQINRGLLSTITFSLSTNSIDGKSNDISIIYFLMTEIILCSKCCLDLMSFNTFCDWQKHSGLISSELDYTKKKNI